MEGLETLVDFQWNPTFFFVKHAHMKCVGKGAIGPILHSKGTEPNHACSTKKHKISNTKSMDDFQTKKVLLEKNLTQILVKLIRATSDNLTSKDS